MAAIMRLLRKVRDLVGWAYLPTDLRGLWELVRPYLLPAAGAILIAAAAWLREAPLWQIAFITVAVFVGIYVGIALVNSVKRHIPPTNPKPDDGPQDRTTTPQPDELKGLCLNLAEEIRDYMSWRDRTNPYWGAAEEREKRAKTEQEKRRLWAKDKVAEFRHGEETIELYHEIFDERTVRLYEALEQRGWLGPQHRERHFDNAENSAYIHGTADLLEDRGNKLP